MTRKAGASGTSHQAAFLIGTAACGGSSLCVPKTALASEKEREGGRANAKGGACKITCFPSPVAMGYGALSWRAWPSTRGGNDCVSLGGKRGLWRERNEGKREPGNNGQRNKNQHSEAAWLALRAEARPRESTAALHKSPWHQARLRKQRGHRHGRGTQRRASAARSWASCSTLETNKVC